MPGPRTFQDRQRANSPTGEIPSIRGNRDPLRQSLAQFFEDFDRDPSALSPGDISGALVASPFGGKAGDGANEAQAAFNAVFGAQLTKGLSLENEENRRRDEALGFARGEFDQFNQSFADSEKGLRGLQFSFSGDKAGVQARQGISQLRGLLGARSLGGGSGAATGLASRIAFQQQGQLIGAKRDIALDAARRAAVHRAQRAQFSGNVTNLINQGPSMIGLDTLTNATDIRAAQFSNELELNEARSARRAGERAATIGGIANVGGAILGGL